MNRGSVNPASRFDQVCQGEVVAERTVHPVRTVRIVNDEHAAFLVVVRGRGVDQPARLVLQARKAEVRLRNLQLKTWVLLPGIGGVRPPGVVQVESPLVMRDRQLIPVPSGGEEFTGRTGNGTDPGHGQGVGIDCKEPMVPVGAAVQPAVLAPHQTGDPHAVPARPEREFGCTALPAHRTVVVVTTADASPRLRRQGSVGQGVPRAIDDQCFLPVGNPKPVVGDRKAQLI